MKAAFILLVTLACMQAAVISDGSGFFPVVVLVMQADGVTPAQGVSVRLADLPKYVATESDPKKQVQVLPATLGKAVATDDKGCAVVFFHAGWGSSSGGDKQTYEQGIHGTLIVERQGREVFRISLKDWAKTNGYSPKGHEAPFVTVVLKK